MIQAITPKQAHIIIETLSPEGNFITFEEGYFIAIDNTTSEAYTRF